MAINDLKILLDLIHSIKAGLQEACVGKLGPTHTRLSPHTDPLFPDGPPSRSLCQLLYKSEIQLHRTVCHWKKKICPPSRCCGHLCRPSTSTVRPTYLREKWKKGLNHDRPPLLWPRPRYTLFLPCFAFAQAASIYLEMGLSLQGRVEGRVLLG